MNDDPLNDSTLRRKEGREERRGDDERARARETEGGLTNFSHEIRLEEKYRGEPKGLQILLSYSQAGPGRKAKQGQEEITRNHVQAF